MERLVKYRNWLLLAVALTLVVAIPIAQRLTFDQTVESFFAPDNSDIQLLRESRQDFGGDEFVIVAWREPGLIQNDPEKDIPDLSETAAGRIANLSEKLGNLPGVDKARTRDLQRFLTKSPYNKNTRLKMLQLFDGVLIGPDQESTAIVLQLLSAEDSPVTREVTVASIRKTASETIPGSFVAGEAVQIQDMFNLVERDGNILYIASLAVLSVMLLVIFKNVRWVLASIGIVIASVTCTRALLVIAGAQLSMVSSMLNSLVTVISIGTTTHIIVYYRELRTELDAEAATLRTLRELWHPVLWTMITIAVGFAALLVSDIIPVRSFAIMMTLGTLMVLVMTLAVLPATFASSSKVPIPGQVRMEESLDRMLDRMANVIDRHPTGTTVWCLVLTAVTAPGLFIMQIQTDFSKNFRESSPIVQSLQFIESNLGPAGSWDVAFDVPDPITNEFLNNTRKLTDRLNQLSDEGIELDVLSLNDAIDIPPRFGSPVKRLNTLMARQEDLVASFYNPDRRRMRIVLRSVEQQSTQLKLDQIENVRNVVADHFEKLHAIDAERASVALDDRDSVEVQTTETPPTYSATASGLFVLTAHMIDSLLSDQMKSFMWASIGTVICMWIAFRSLRIGLISLVPNVFPIALVTGSLGLLNVPVNIGTAMIAAVAMGFTCSVHYIAVFEKSLPKDGLTKALQTAQSGVGKAVVLAHIALVAGFMVLTFSEFIPLVYFGALLSLSMIGGLISDLVLLPLLLRWTTKDPTIKPPVIPGQFSSRQKNKTLREERVSS
ncbi:MAG TPA: MMPL family transporter [Planctomycetaceae bacterium]|nr:MMPL family transporter [Planctomycetaceae bacterium]